MSARARITVLLTAGSLAVLTATTTGPAAAQGDPVYGEGDVYLYSGALNDTGIAQWVHSFGEADDEVYMGDWYGDGTDLPMVRRGNIFFVPAQHHPIDTAAVFAYGDEGDELYVGDWDGDGVDSLAVRRDNLYLVKNDNRRSGVADTEFFYGDPDDIVLVGNWNGSRVAPRPGAAGKGDTLIVLRDNYFFVKNDLRTGTADHVFVFGDPDDEILVGDWVTFGETEDGFETVEDGNGADQLAVRRGNVYHQSGELAGTDADINPATVRVFAYGEPDDSVFVASLPTPVDDDGQIVHRRDATGFVTGDGLGVRRPR